jgi:hypothetical protein
MKGFFGKVVIGLAVLCAVGSARPASAQTFDQQIAYLRAQITGPWANCFKCDGLQTTLNLLNGAEAAHNAGNTALCMQIIQMAINCNNTPSRDIFVVASFNLGPPRTITLNGTGLPTPISVVLSFLLGEGSAPPNLPGPIYPVYKFFSYTNPVTGFIDLGIFDACRREAHDPLVAGLGVLLALC